MIQRWERAVQEIAASTNQVVPLEDRLGVRDTDGAAIDARQREPASVDPLFRVGMPVDFDPMQDPIGRKIVERAAKQAADDSWTVAQGEIATVQQRYQQAISELEHAARAIHRFLATDVVDIALVVAKSIVSRELELHRDELIDTLHAALQLVGNECSVTVRISPKDLEHVESYCQDNQLERVKLVADESIKFGGCAVETPSQVIDGTVESRVEAVREAMISLIASDTENEEPSITETRSDVEGE